MPDTPNTADAADINHDGGMQFWIQKHDVLLLEYAKLVIAYRSVQERLLNSDRELAQMIAREKLREQLANNRDVGREEIAASKPSTD